MHVQSYLFFNGRCDEALAFYKEALGAEVEFLMRYKDSPEPCDPGKIPPGFDDKVMHSSFRVGDAVLMASDGNSTAPAKFDGFSLSLRYDTEAQAEKAFQVLANGGKVCVPLMKTFFSPKFGMLSDRFGVPWMVLVGQSA